MAHNSTLVQGGETLYAVTEDGIATVLTPPSTVTVTDGRPPRYEVSGVHAVQVNSVDQPIMVDDAGIVLFLSPRAPTAAPTLAASAGAGALTGTFGVKYTFGIRTLDGVLVAESGFSPSASITVTAKKIVVRALQAMPGLTSIIDPRYEIVRRVYRTSANTTTYFLWHTVEDNTTTSFEDDAAIATLAAEALGTVPFLSHIASFRDRLFGVNDAVDRESLLYSEAGLPWAWPEDNFFQAPQIKGDAQSGITALIPRRETLGIAKSNMLLQLTGSSDDDFRIVVISTTIGALNQESVAGYRDDVYFLGSDGVYKWGEDGLNSISDGRVRSWFTTDDYFDRDSFITAKGVVDPRNKVYKLQLQEAGEDAVKAWIGYDMESKTWWGPQRTDSFDLTSTLILSSHIPITAFGTNDGFIIIDSDDRNDDDTPIEIEGILSPISITDPPSTVYFGTLTVEVDSQDDGILQIYPRVGEPDEAEDPVFNHDLTIPSVSVGRLGYGRFLSLRFYNNTLNQLIQILGFEVDPVNSVGKRR